MAKLILPEHLMLLALSDDKGSVVQSGSIALPYGLAGAIVMELSRRGAVSLEGEMLKLESSDRLGDEILDEAISSIGKSSKLQKASYWIARPDKLVKGLKQRVLDRLVQREILRAEEHRFMWLIPYTRYPEQDDSVETGMRQHMYEVVFSGAESDEETALLLSLVHACTLEKEVFPGEDTKAVTKALEEFTKGDRVAKAISDEVAAITAMLIASAVSGAVVTSVIH
jgi:hypothetical protein